MKTIVGIVGVKTSGKDTVADIILSLKSESVKYALADKLKNICTKTFDIPRKHFDDQSIKEVKFNKPIKLNSNHLESILQDFKLHISLPNIQRNLESPRDIAQFIGTEILRKYGGEDIHCINILLDKDIVIISDVRFPNEFNYFNHIEGINFVPLYIKREEAEKAISPNSHSSETSIFDFCHKCILVDNNSSLEDLKTKVIDIVNEKI